jgi:threonine/homoserine/homoserine lactone efflux protein
MTAFWEGVLAGYGIAVPVGAIAILIVDMGLRCGFRLGFMAGAGAASADFIYAGLAALAGEALATMLTPFALPLRIASALVLLGLGSYGLWQARSAAGRDSGQPAVANGHVRVYGQFLGLTLLNPVTIAYFSALILGRGVGSATSVGERAAFVIGAALASLSWQTFLAGAGSLAKRRLSPSFQTLTSVLGNLVVIGLGVRILIQLFD